MEFLTPQSQEGAYLNNSVDVTIGIPVYNGERYLGESLRSVLAQTVTPHLLVFDNASTDGTREVAQSLIPEESIWDSDRNVGAVANFNRAVETAKTTWFAWLADDDRLVPTYVEKCLSAMTENPGAVACLPGIRYIDPDGRPLREQTDPSMSSANVRVRARSMLRRSRWTEVYCFYRRDVLLRSPGFADEYGADVLLTWWYLLRYPFVVLSEPLLEYREYSAKTTAEMSEALRPGQSRGHWLKISMWRRLWQMTADEDLPRRTKRAAKWELLMAVPTRWGFAHLREDVVMRVEDAFAGRETSRCSPWRVLARVHHRWVCQRLRRRA